MNMQVTSATRRSHFMLADGRRLETLASRIAGATRVLDRNAGGAILWARATEILRDLVARARDAI